MVLQSAVGPGGDTHVYKWIFPRNGLPECGLNKSKVLRVGGQEEKIMNRLELYRHELKFVVLR